MARNLDAHADAGPQWSLTNWQIPVGPSSTQTLLPWIYENIGPNSIGT
jgi:hypothetical protein